jgi:type I restriction enzyme S subunit
MNGAWEVRPLGMICENLDKQRVPITKRNRVKGPYPYYGASGIVDHVNEYLFDEDLLLVSEDGANLLARTYPIAFSVTGKIWVNNHAHVLKFDHSDKQNFVEYYLNSIKLDDYVSGMAQPKLNQKSLNSIVIPQPPLEEQQRIVAVLDGALSAVNDTIAHTERNLQNCRELFDSTLQTVFSNPAGDWEEKALGETCDLISGQHINKKDYNTESKGMGYLTGPSDFGGLHPSVSRWTEVPKSKAIKHDILITVKGSGIGKLNVLNFDEVAISRQLMAIRPKSINNKFLYAFLKTNYSHFQSLGNGAAIPGISRVDVLNLSCPIPPAKDQQLIVNQIDEILIETQRLETIYTQKLTALAELKKSVLHQAFSGNLT